MDELSVEEARALIMADGGEEDGESPACRDSRDAAQEAVAALLDDGDGSAALDESAQALFEEGSVGLGVDIVEIERVERALDRSPAFARMVFSEAERAYCESKANAATHYAARFAAKEAVVKALGTGFAQGIGVHDIEVERTKGGKPLVKLSGRALEYARERGVREFSLSLSYTHSVAVACALAVTESAVRASQKRKDPMEELAKQFKETRGILDEL